MFETTRDTRQDDGKNDHDSADPWRVDETDRIGDETTDRCAKCDADIPAELETLNKQVAAELSNQKALSASAK